ncbi:MAG: NUDIX hydrolase [Candidatus Dojkabacteria bacterium]
MLNQLLQIREEILYNRFSTMGRPFLEYFQMSIIPPWPDYDEDEVITFEVTSAAVVVVFNFEGEQWILLTQQADRDGNPWELPSGKVDRELDKSPEDTARRELIEETGFDVDKLTPLTYGWRVGDKKGGLQYFSVVNAGSLNIASREEERIYLAIPDEVDKNEISGLCLEKLNLKGTSLLHSSGHPWAYKRTFGALEQKLAMES